MSKFKRNRSFVAKSSTRFQNCPKIAPSPSGIVTPSDQAHSSQIVQNGISIGSAVFVWVPNLILYNALSMSELWPYATCTKIGKDRACRSGDIFADGQDRHKWIFITILRNCSRGRSNYVHITGIDCTSASTKSPFQAENSTFFCKNKNTVQNLPKHAISCKKFFLGRRPPLTVQLHLSLYSLFEHKNVKTSDLGVATRRTVDG